jgi:hypothetical protein
MIAGHEYYEYFFVIDFIFQSLFSIAGKQGISTHQIRFPFMVQVVEYLEANDSDAIPLLRILNLGTSIPTNELRTVQEYISDCNTGTVDVPRLCLL